MLDKLNRLVYTTCRTLKLTQTKKSFDILIKRTQTIKFGAGPLLYIKTLLPISKGDYRKYWLCVFLVTSF